MTTSHNFWGQIEDYVVGAMDIAIQKLHQTDVMEVQKAIDGLCAMYTNEYGTKSCQDCPIVKSGQPACSDKNSQYKKMLNAAVIFFYEKNHFIDMLEEIKKGVVNGSIKV